MTPQYEDKEEGHVCHFYIRYWYVYSLSGINEITCSPKHLAIFQLWTTFGQFWLQTSHIYSLFHMNLLNLMSNIFQWFLANMKSCAIDIRNFIIANCWGRCYIRGLLVIVSDGHGLVVCPWWGHWCGRLGIFSPLYCHNNPIKDAHSKKQLKLLVMFSPGAKLFCSPWNLHRFNVQWILNSF